MKFRKQIKTNERTNEKKKKNGENETKQTDNLH